MNKNQVVTGECRLSFVNLFEAKAMKEGDIPKYSVTIIIPKSDTKTIEAIKASIQAAIEMGKDKCFGGRIPANVATTFRDGDTEVNDIGDLQKEKYPEYEGSYYMRVSTKIKPKVFGPDRQEIIDPSEVYSGCYGRVSLTVFPYAKEGKRGISASLNNVMKTKDGDPLTSALNGDEFSE